MKRNKYLPLWKFLFGVWFGLLKIRSNFTLTELVGTCFPVTPLPVAYYKSQVMNVIDKKNIVGCANTGIYPKQVIGLVPLLPCDECECPDDTCFKLKVFADSEKPIDPVRNDKNSFILQGMFDGQILSLLNYRIEKFDGTNWVDTFSTAQSGTSTVDFYAGDIAYAGFTVDWNKVLVHASGGEGQYRVVYKSFTYNGLTTDKLCSPTFILKEYDCDLADGTTKFECQMSNTVSDIYSHDGDKFTLCYKADGITKRSWYDSIRVNGWLGSKDYKLSNKYTKYPIGAMQQKRSEMIPAYEWLSDDMPQWFHDRFLAYCLRANSIIVTDYNLSNSDKFAIQIPILFPEDSSYKPEFIEQGSKQRGLLRVKTTLQIAVQNQIKSFCC